jgi:hypothetical protein
MPAGRHILASQIYMGHARGVGEPCASLLPAVSAFDLDNFPPDNNFANSDLSAHNNGSGGNHKQNHDSGYEKVRMFMPQFL